MKRPKPPKRSMIYVLTDPKLLAEIRAAAKADLRTTPGFVRHAVVQLLKQREETAARD